LPKLSDLRARLRKEPKPEPTGGPYTRSKLFKIREDGSSALLLFGRHRGMTLEQVQVKEPGYLDFMLRSEFPPELKDVVRHVQARAIKTSMDEAADDVARAFGPKKTEPLVTFPRTPKGLPK
jgi:hypothetical protein